MRTRSGTRPTSVAVEEADGVELVAGHGEAREAVGAEDTAVDGVVVTGMMSSVFVEDGWPVRSDV